MCLNSRVQIQQQTFPPLKWREDEDVAEGLRVEIPSVLCSQHGSHTYIEAYLSSMVIIAYLCIKNSLFLFILDGLLCVAKFVVIFLLFVTNRRRFIVTEHGMNRTHFS